MFLEKNHNKFSEVHSSDSGMYSCHNLQTPHEEPDQFNLTVLGSNSVNKI